MFEDIFQDGDNIPAAKNRGVEHFYKIEGGIDVKSGFTHDQANGLNGISLLTHYRFIN
jgi:hypothetical protein